MRPEPFPEQHPPAAHVVALARKRGPVDLGRVASARGEDGQAEERAVGITGSGQPAAVDTCRFEIAITRMEPPMWPEQHGRAG